MKISYWRFESPLAPAEVEARLRSAVDPPGLFGFPVFALREFMGSVERESFAVRLKTRNTWKPFAYGRVAAAPQGSVVTVELRRPDSSGIALAFAILCVLLFASLLFIPTALPSTEALAGMAAVTLGGLGLLLFGPFVGRQEERRILETLSQLLRAPASPG